MATMSVGLTSNVELLHKTELNSDKKCVLLVSDVPYNKATSNPPLQPSKSENFVIDKGAASAHRPAWLTFRIMFKYDSEDGEYETIELIQIDLPSTRLVLNPQHYLNRVKKRIMKKVMAQHVKIGDLVLRDGETATEAVLDIKTVQRTVEDDSQISDGTIIVNNVLVSYKK